MNNSTSTTFPRNRARLLESGIGVGLHAGVTQWHSGADGLDSRPRIRGDKESQRGHDGAPSANPAGFNGTSGPYASWWHETDPRSTGIALVLSLEELARCGTARLCKHERFGRVWIRDGALLEVECDAARRELMTHLPLMARTARRARVLVLGGGDCAIPAALAAHGADTVGEILLVDHDDILALAADAGALPDDGRFRSRPAGRCIDFPRAIRDSGLFDLVIVDSTPDDPASIAAIADALVGCLSPAADVVIRDAPLLTTQGARWQNNGHALARALRDRLPGASLACAAAPTPFQRGGFHAFFFLSLDGRDLAEPVGEWRGRHYDVSVHRGAMALPAWWPTVDERRLAPARHGEDPRTWWHEHTEESGITQALRMRRTLDAPSAMQSIEVFEHAKFGTVLALDGTVQVSSADEAIYHEMAVHIPLLSRRFEDAGVLIIGGGDGGMLREVLRHDFVRRAVMVEIDPAVIEVSNRHMKIEGDYADPRVELVTDDGAAWLPAARSRGEKFDLVIIDATDSTGPSSTLWNEAFYGHVAAVLKEDGLCLDSDIAIPSLSAGLRFSRDPCPLGIFDLVRTRRPFAATECFYTRVPLYPAGYFAFFVHSQTGVSCASPQSDFVGRHYTPEVHRAAFALPRWWRKTLDELRSPNR